MSDSETLSFTFTAAGTRYTKETKALIPGILRHVSIRRSDYPTLESVISARLFLRDITTGRVMCLTDYQELSYDNPITWKGNVPVSVTGKVSNTVLGIEAQSTYAGDTADMEVVWDY